MVHSPAEDPPGYEPTSVPPEGRVAGRRLAMYALGTEECPSEMWIVDSEPPHRGFFATRAVAEILTAQGEGAGA